MSRGFADEPWEVFPSEIHLIRDPGDSFLDRCHSGTRLRGLFQKERALLPAIVWDLFDDNDELSIREDDQGILENFLRLTDSSDKSPPNLVLKIAKQYGVLFPYPAYNRAFSEQRQLKLEGLVTTFPRHMLNLPFEPVTLWVHLAHKARAILSAAAALHTGKTVPAQDWDTLYEWLPNEAPVSIKRAEYSNLSRHSKPL